METDDEFSVIGSNHSRESSPCPSPGINGLLREQFEFEFVDRIEWDESGSTSNSDVEERLVEVTPPAEPALAIHGKHVCHSKEYEMDSTGPATAETDNQVQAPKMTPMTPTLSSLSTFAKSALIASTFLTLFLVWTAIPHPFSATETQKTQVTPTTTTINNADTTTIAATLTQAFHLRTQQHPPTPTASTIAVESETGQAQKQLPLTPPICPTIYRPEPALSNALVLTDDSILETVGNAAAENGVKPAGLQRQEHASLMRIAKKVKSLSLFTTPQMKGTCPSKQSNPSELILRPEFTAALTRIAKRVRSLSLQLQNLPSCPSTNHDLATPSPNSLSLSMVNSETCLNNKQIANNTKIKKIEECSNSLTRVASNTAKSLALRSHSQSICNNTPAKMSNNTSLSRIPEYTAALTRIGKTAAKSVALHVAKQVQRFENAGCPSSNLELAAPSPSSLSTTTTTRDTCSNSSKPINTGVMRIPEYTAALTRIARKGAKSVVLHVTKHIQRFENAACPSSNLELATPSPSSLSTTGTRDTFSNSFKPTNTGVMRIPEYTAALTRIAKKAAKSVVLHVAKHVKHIEHSACPSSNFDLAAPSPSSLSKTTTTRESCPNGSKPTDTAIIRIPDYTTSLTRIAKTVKAVALQVVQTVPRVNLPTCLSRNLNLDASPLFSSAVFVYPLTHEFRDAKIMAEEFAVEIGSEENQVKEFLRKTGVKVRKMASFGSNAVSAFVDSIAN